MKNNIVSLFFNFVFSSILYAEEVKKSGEIVTLTTGDWPPYVSKSKLKHQGVIARIVKEAFAEVGVVVKFDFQPWKRSMETAREGKADGTFIWSRKPEREKDFYYSEPLGASGYWFFHRKDLVIRGNKFDWKNWGDLKGIQIGATLGYNYGPTFFAAEKAGEIKVNWLPKDKQNIGMLINKRIQIFPQDIDAGYEQILTNFPPAEASLVTHHPKEVKPATPFHLLMAKVVKKSPQILKLFNKGLTVLKQSGKFDKYYNESRRGEYKIK
ncbi:substrate-binding periplasmic protein [Spartinivicinus ruber]|uniref:substrate-binding periplasmic protein n=1 Tax=Spartinivicinus ruber TaxID=2683272 RepID=UPI0013D2B8D0|nr:ABC transporter substrate-binding protein [Spartinivicinus ruber]